MTILVSIGILALLILVHEAGHFAAARLQGIHASRFSLGFGPAIWRYQGSETEYAVRALPLGGFVGFPDDDEDCPYPADDPNLLRNRPVLDRAVVMVAGVLANLVFAYLVLLVQTGVVGMSLPPTYLPGITLPQIAADGPAAVAGLQANDVVLKARDRDFTRIPSAEDAAAQIEIFRDLIRTNRAAAIPLLVQRGDDILSLTVVPTGEPDEAIIGVTLSPTLEAAHRPAASLGELFQETNTQYQNLVGLNIRGLVQLVSNFGETAGQLSGPVGIVRIGADLVANDASSIFWFTALISINLAILNILPLPALDGGQLLFLGIEAVRGQRLPKILEERVMQTGLVFLLGLGVILIFKDTLTIFRQ